MQVLERSKREVEAKANTMSDFLRMEYLELVLRKNLDPEVLRYCYQELSKLYELRSMYPEALKYLAKQKEICILQREKIDCVNKEIELSIKSGNFDRAEIILKDGIKDLSEKDKFEIRRKMIEAYKQEASKLESSGRNTGALKIYEKLVAHVVDNERTDVKKKMLVAYKKLGRVKESIEIERQLMREVPGFRGELVEREI